MSSAKDFETLFGPVPLCRLALGVMGLPQSQAQEAEALAGLEGGNARYLTAEDGSSSGAKTLTPKRLPNTPRPWGKFWEAPPGAGRAGRYGLLLQRLS